MNGTEVLAHLDLIAATSSRTEKEALVERVADDPLFQRVVKATYDPFVTYGITPPKVTGQGTNKIELEHPIWDVLDDLAARRLTGKAASETVREWMLQLDALGSQLLWRILSKDLRCGITAKTVNRVCPGTVPSFDVMLAHKYEEKRIKTFPVAIEPKLDGLRTLGIFDGTRGGFFSRTGKPFPSLEHLVEPVLTMINRARATVQHVESAAAANLSDEKLRRIYWHLLGGDAGPRLVVDGEAIAGNFNETTGAVRRKSEVASDAVLNLFEVLPHELFMQDKPEIAIKYAARRRFAEFVVSCAVPTAPIKLVGRYLASSHEEIQTYYSSFRDAGLEGAIVKPLDGTYAKKRSHAWLKMKNEETVDVRVTGVFEGTGKYEGLLGGLIVDVDGVEVRVGGGLSDAQREEFWRLQDEVIGRLVEVEFHEKTPDGSLRHPRFVRFRDDKDPALGSKEAAE